MADNACSVCWGLKTDCRVCSGTGVLGERPPLLMRVKRRDLSLFGTDEFPLRCSSLGAMVACPWRYAMQFLFDQGESEAGPAADTGSAAHAAVAAWHTNDKDATAAVRSMVDRGNEYPLADLDEAAAMFLLYSRDPRNAGATVVAVEQDVSFVLPPCPSDETKKGIVVWGTVDQVRLGSDGRLCVYDLKTSKKSGLVLMQEHQYQVAAYCVGASRRLGKPVHPGALICPRHYQVKRPPETEPDGVFFEYAWSLEDCIAILLGVRHVVAAIRRGDVHHQAGESCRWCPSRTPDVCVPKLRSVLDPLTLRVVVPPPAPAPVVPAGAEVDLPWEM